MFGWKELSACANWTDETGYDVILPLFTRAMNCALNVAAI